MSVASDEIARAITDFQAKDTKKHADKRLPETISRNAKRLDDLLATIAVCDLAIGSGAFAVGMMVVACSTDLVALFVGIELTSNFKLPYFSRSISEFWERWHVSLSNWLRDYLYA